MKSKNDLRRGLRIPKKSKGLAEFLGILTGDGYMNFYPYNNEYVVEIAGHSKDDLNYFKYLNVLILKLFNIEPKKYIRKDQNSAYLRLRSKGVFYFLKKMGFVIGRKGQINIPEWIKKDDLYMAYFIKGLVDTDGSLSLKKRYKSKPYYPVINISSKSKILLNIVSSWLRKRGFSYWFGKEIKKDKRNDVITKIYRVELSGKKNLVNWIKFIGFSNYKHIKKVKYGASGTFTPQPEAKVI